MRRPRRGHGRKSWRRWRFHDTIARRRSGTDIALELHAPEFPFAVGMDQTTSSSQLRTTWYAPMVARRDLADARPYWLRRAGARPDDRAPGTADRPSILLIDSVERRIRRLGYDPIRTFDAERRWRLEAAGVVIAEGRSLDELSRAAHAWLEARRGPE